MYIWHIGHIYENVSHFLLYAYRNVSHNLIIVMIVACFDTIVVAEKGLSNAPTCVLFSAKSVKTT